MVAARSAHPRGIARLEQIALERLAPTLPAPPANPTVQQAMEAWMAMARGYASIVVRQHEFEGVVIDVLKDLDRRVGALASLADVEGEPEDPSLEGEAPIDPR
jgi:hypothetical protein